MNWIKNTYKTNFESENGFRAMSGHRPLTMKEYDHKLKGTEILTKNKKSSKREKPTWDK